LGADASSLVGGVGALAGGALASAGEVLAL